jgi:hypothetical protein
MDKPAEPIHGPAEPIHAPLPPPPFAGACILAGPRASPGSRRLPPNLASRSQIWPLVAGSAMEFLDLAIATTARRRSSPHEGGARRRGRRRRARAWT